MSKKEEKNVLFFNQLRKEDVGIVGGKNSSLGEMYRNLTEKGVQVPNGFAVTAHAYDYLVEKSGIMQNIREILSDLDTTDMKNLAIRGEKVRHLFLNAEFPQEIKESIIKAYADMCKQYGDNVDVAVRSSATAEDLPDASFAGQQETFLNIRGPEMLLDACRRCFASLFTNRAISYRVDKNFDHFKVALSIGVQKMVRSDKASAGVMFSIDTESGFQDVVFITAAYGLGENVVQGAVNPDEYYVHKPTLKKGFKSLIHKEVGEKAIKMIYTHNGIKPVKNIQVSKEDRNKFALSEDEILTLAKWACIIEDHYSEKAGHFKPMDMEWAKDGDTGELFIVQARPETVQSRKDVTKIETYVLKEQGKVLVEGHSVGERIGAGDANVIKNVHDIGEFKKGQVLVTDMTDPDWEPIMKIAAAIVTNRGGRTCHAAIISRELGIPCVVGTGNATENILPGTNITVDCSEGDIGKVYEGILKFDIETTDLSIIPETKTKIMMNLANPEEAFNFSFLPNKGVGLAREEFIINSFIKIHPQALLQPDKVTDKKVQKKIADLTKGYDDKVQYYVDKLAMGIARLSAAFYPKDVILRFSDFKSNEYANLIGGTFFEPKEDNPMIGFRGSSRYYSEAFKEAFGLECKAVFKVRNEMGLTNLKVMIPFCRTVEEGKKVLAEMEKNGLKKGENGLEVICMCEIPANVILAEEFLEIFDGFSIGSNDLTQLTLGLDRDSELVADIYDERNAAVKKLIAQVIKVANEKGKYIGICGQAPSDFPDFAEFVVEAGIHSMSLNPDTVVKTTLLIAEKEKQLGIK